MRKILFALFVLIVVTCLMACTPHHTVSNSSNLPDVTINYHDAPFEEYICLDKITIDYSVYESAGNNLIGIFSGDYDGSYDSRRYSDNYEGKVFFGTNPDKSFLYVLRIIGTGEATLETYPKCSITDSNHTHGVWEEVGMKNPRCMRPGCVLPSTELDYYSTTPMAAYYFRFESQKYVFATKDFRLGEAVEIKGCWNIGPDREYQEFVTDYLNGFIYLTENDLFYCPATEAFCYRCDLDDKGKLKALKPLYLYNQLYEGHDSFNADGETKEGWNNKISVLSGYSLNGWISGRWIDFPDEILADPRTAMVKTWIDTELGGEEREVIETEARKPQS